MERLKNMSLKRAFFTITVLSLIAATILSVLSGAIIIRLRDNIYYNPNSILLALDNDGALISDVNLHDRGQRTSLIDVLQMGLPVLFYVAALLAAAMLFYRLKIKKPLAILHSGAERIRRQDLDFTVEKYADDEFGALCAAFETMRGELLKSNRELWRQMEERKRLNAAFSHDLRNPVTVMKGSAAILRKGLEKGHLTEESAGETVSMIIQYAGRIENYIEAMTSAQRLEDLKCSPQPVGWLVLAKELENSLTVLSAGAYKKIIFSHTEDDRTVKADKYYIHNVSENLVSNAIRYAKNKLNIGLSCDDEKIAITVLDDGPGFTDAILNKGPVPFLRDDNAEQGAHFGMGLYICRLLCEKHGGYLSLENTPNGAKATAVFYMLGN